VSPEHSSTDCSTNLHYTPVYSLLDCLEWLSVSSRLKCKLTTITYN